LPHVSFTATPVYHRPIEMGKDTFSFWKPTTTTQAFGTVPTALAIFVHSSRLKAAVIDSIEALFAALLIFRGIATPTEVGEGIIATV
jgi:hypothetical protein